MSWGLERMLLHSMEKARVERARQVRQEARQAERDMRTPKQQIYPYTHNENECNWVMWRVYFKHVAANARWDEMTARRMLITSLRGSAMMIGGRVAVEQTATNYTLDHLLNQLEKLFLPQAKSDMCKRVFENCHQLPREELEVFHRRVLELYMRAYPDKPQDEDRMIEKFYAGLNSTRIREATQRAKPANYDAVLQAAQAELAIILFNQPVSSKAASLTAMGTGTGAPIKVEPQDVGLIAAFDRNNLCYECQAPGHIARNCPKRKPGEAKKAFVRFRKPGDNKSGDKPKDKQPKKRWFVKKAVMDKLKKVGAVGSLEEAAESADTAEASGEAADGAAAEQTNSDQQIAFCAEELAALGIESGGAGAAVEALEEIEVVSDSGDEEVDFLG